MFLTEIYIYMCFFNEKLHLIEKYYSILAEEEKHRANKFKCRKSTENYIIARGILRGIMGAHLNCSPEELNFSYSQNGKPYIKNSLWKFNLSHTSDMCIIALNAENDIGVDVEKKRQIVLREKIIDRFFSSKEKEIYRKLNEGKDDFFWKVWTRKEAYLKAQGGNLKSVLNNFSVISSDSTYKRFDDPLFIGDYYLSNLNVLDSHHISLCYKGIQKKTLMFNI